MLGLKVGHVSLQEKGTGVTVFLFEKAAVGAYLLCGSAPASHELAPLDPETSVTQLHGLVLTGGSAFGLQTAGGVMRYLAEHHIGITTPHGVVPIVPTVAIYDLAFKTAAAPTAEDAYQAALIASDNNRQIGQVGAGTGATVGKAIKGANCMTGGLGFAEIKLTPAITVWAYVVVNASGDVRNAQQEIIAGACRLHGDEKEFFDIRETILENPQLQATYLQQNTTLACVITNAKFNQAELKQVAKMTVAGFANAISPVMTPYDGDIIFAISLGEESASVYAVGIAAAQATQHAITIAVQASVVVV